MNDLTNDSPENPRAVIGGNEPPLPALISVNAESTDFARMVTDWLNDRYGSSPEIVQAMLDEARALPETIEDDDAKGRYTSLIKRIRDEAKKLDSFHEKEATPYLRGKQAVDQFFFGLIDRLARRDKKNKPGAADVLGQRLTAYDTKKLAEEQARRQAEAARLAREAEERRQAEIKAAREAEEARLAAERARNPEKIEEKRGAADAKDEAATAAAAAAEIAAQAAQAARVETFAKPADIMRTRGDDGTLSTMQTEPYAEVIPGQDGLLDKEKLWPFIKLEAKEAALRAWAKNTGYTQQMPGATIGKRPKSVVR